MWLVISLRRSFVQVGDKVQGARKGIGRGTLLPRQNSVVGIEGIGSLRFSQIVGQLADEVAPM